MNSFIHALNLCLCLLFFGCYFYQLVYVGIVWFKKDRLSKYKAARQHRYAIVISARNESAVIGNLLSSIGQQTYPSELYDIYVMADNCTDNTADIAREAGAIVYERSSSQVGKGYALDAMFRHIEAERGITYYDAYLVFDADNVLDPHYLEEMNRTFDAGYRVITSYRNSKNYDSNWISAGYALWFLRESKYLNGARMRCGSSCAISGTGFLVSSEIIAKNGGWKHHLLTEDIEFSIDNATQGEVIGYCEKAIVYDEQPVQFKASWKQRMRWAKGFYQVFARYGRALVNGCLHHSFQCYDMLMTIAPALLISLLGLGINGTMLLYGLATDQLILADSCLSAILAGFGSSYVSLFFFGVITTISEWDKIYCSTPKKILYLFTFPVFIFTYIPIAVAALVRPVRWEPIQHSICKNVQQITQ